eukprot:jgi/Botrbrau1/20406/Bobra.0006s0063.3
MFCVFFVELGAVVPWQGIQGKVRGGNTGGGDLGWVGSKLIVNKLVPNNPRTKEDYGKRAKNWKLECRWLRRTDLTPKEAFEISEASKKKGGKTLYIVLVEPAQGGQKTRLVRLLESLGEAQRVAALYKDDCIDKVIKEGKGIPYILGQCPEASGHQNDTWETRSTSVTSYLARLCEVTDQEIGQWDSSAAWKVSVWEAAKLKPGKDSRNTAFLALQGFWKPTEEYFIYQYLQECIEDVKKGKAVAATPQPSIEELCKGLLPAAQKSSKKGKKKGEKVEHEAATALSSNASTGLVGSTPSNTLAVAPLSAAGLGSGDEAKSTRQGPGEGAGLSSCVSLDDGQPDGVAPLPLAETGSGDEAESSWQGAGEGAGPSAGLSLDDGLREAPLSSAETRSGDEAQSLLLGLGEGADPLASGFLDDAQRGQAAPLSSEELGSGEEANSTQEGPGEGADPSTSVSLADALPDRASKGDGASSTESSFGQNIEREIRKHLDANMEVLTKSLKQEVVAGRKILKKDMNVLKRRCEALEECVETLQKEVQGLRKENELGTKKFEVIEKRHEVAIEKMVTLEVELGNVRADMSKFKNVVNHARASQQIGDLRRLVVHFCTMEVKDPRMPVQSVGDVDVRQYRQCCDELLKSVDDNAGTKTAKVMNTLQRRLQAALPGETEEHLQDRVIEILEAFREQWAVDTVLARNVLVHEHDREDVLASFSVVKGHVSQEIWNMANEFVYWPGQKH